MGSKPIRRYFFQSNQPKTAQELMKQLQLMPLHNA
jgi:hypothetical protein